MKKEAYIVNHLLLQTVHILNRGYSITTYNGKTVKSIKDINDKDIIETKLIDGSFKSKVEK